MSLPLDTEQQQQKEAIYGKTGTISKRPVYVYVDYTYQDKMQDKLVKQTTTSAPSKPVEPRLKRESLLSNGHTTNPYASVVTRKSSQSSKLEDLFNNSCSANTGTAISSIAELIPASVKTSLSNTIQSLNRHVTNSVNGSDSIGSSRVSSSNDSNSNLNNLCSNKTNEDSQYQLLSYEDRIKYQTYLANSSRSSQPINNSWSSHTINPKTVMTLGNKKATTFFKSESITQIKTNLDNSMLRGGVLIRPKEFEAKHETSV